MPTLCRRISMGTPEPHEEAEIVIESGRIRAIDPAKGFDTRALGPDPRPGRRLPDAGIGAT